MATTEVTAEFLLADGLPDSGEVEFRPHIVAVDDTPDPHFVTRKPVIALLDAEGKISVTITSSDDDGWRLDGHKAVVMGGPTADRLIVTARNAGERRDRDGITLFVVDPAADGVRRRDYPTVDGTGVRDYIHVMDLADGHLAAFRDLCHSGHRSGYEAINLGTGRGYSVLEMVRTFEAVTGRPVPYRVAPRRAGDAAACYADPARAAEKLGWRTRRDLAEMCESAWRFQRDMVT